MWQAQAPCRAPISTPARKGSSQGPQVPTTESTGIRESGPDDPLAYPIHALAADSAVKQTRAIRSVVRCLPRSRTRPGTSSEWVGKVFRPRRKYTPATPDAIPAPTSQAASAGLSGPTSGKTQPSQKNRRPKTSSSGAATCRAGTVAMVRWDRCSMARYLHSMRAPPHCPEVSFGATSRRGMSDFSGTCLRAVAEKKQCAGLKLSRWSRPHRRRRPGPPRHRRRLRHR